MKFQVTSTTLYNRLQTLSRVLSSKNTIQILDCILFELSENNLKMTASDSETTLITNLLVSDTEGSGRFAIRASTILNGLKEFYEQPITIEVNEESFEVKVFYQNGKSSFIGQNADDYILPQSIADDVQTITLDSSILYNGVSRALFATAEDELRPVMNGIYFDIAEGHITFVASDGHKLVRDRNTTVHAEQATSFILPKKPATLLKNLLGKDGGDVTILFDERNAQINYGDGTLTCRLIEGRYPNYNSVIPQGNPNLLTVDRQALLAALRRVQPFANDSSNLIRFHVEGGTLQLDAEDYDFSKTATERMSCEYSGQPMSIGFKGASFIEILSNFDCQEVIIQLADPSRAGLVLPSEQPENQDVLMLMMPMLIND